MKSKTQQNMFLRIITMPLRALAKARDFYVRSMNNYADKVTYDTTGWGGPVYADPLTRSFSTNFIKTHDSDHELKELVRRAASTGALGNRIDVSSILSSSASTKKTTANTVVQQQKVGNFGASKGVPRSASVAMAKIEEDNPSEFGDAQVGHGLKNGTTAATKPKIRLFPRSRTSVVGGTKRTIPVF